MEASGGYLDGRNMAATFNMLRANDLLWHFVVHNYLLGQEPPALDLLYWNSDGTRVPGNGPLLPAARVLPGEQAEASRAGSTIRGVGIDTRRVTTPGLRRRLRKRSHRALARGVPDPPDAGRASAFRPGRERPHRRHHQPARPRRSVATGSTRPRMPKASTPTPGWPGRPNTKAVGGWTGYPGWSSMPVSWSSRRRRATTSSHRSWTPLAPTSWKSSQGQRSLQGSRYPVGAE